MTFWEHLDELRTCLIHILIATMVCSIAAFFLREPIFSLIMAPYHSDFITFRIINQLFTHNNLSEIIASDLTLINTGIANQFLVHLRVSVYIGLLCVSPYILYILFGFISPALYSQERKIAIRTTISGYLLFMLGMAVNYFIIFPFSVLFLGSYQVSGEVTNMIDLNSYISMFLLLSLTLGIMFELPVVCAMLGRLGIVDAGLLRTYRRHVAVAILIISAFITPTGDPFTLLLVALPIYILYEVSILVVKRQKTTA